MKSIGIFGYLSLIIWVAVPVTAQHLYVEKTKLCSQSFDERKQSRHVSFFGNTVSSRTFECVLSKPLQSGSLIGQPVLDVAKCKHKSSGWDALIMYVWSDKNNLRVVRGKPEPAKTFQLTKCPK